MRKLQIALDLLDLDKALNIALEVADYIDHVEAGTPLIKKYGMKAVETLDKNIDKPIVADMKIMDTGELEAKLAYEYGADYVTVLAAAHTKTIEDVIMAAKEEGKGSMVDTIAIENPSIVIEKLGRLDVKPDYVLIHSGIDMQVSGITPEKLILGAGEKLREYKLGVAGGINLNNLHRIIGFKEIELIIVGGGLTKTENPRDVARKMKEYLQSTRITR